jgi:hypothetical protein
MYYIKNSWTVLSATTVDDVESVWNAQIPEQVASTEFGSSPAVDVTNDIICKLWFINCTNIHRCFWRI